MAYQTSSIIACGFDVDITEVASFIKENDSIKKTLKIETDDIPTSVKSGILYDGFCHGGLDDVFATQTEMQAWYKKFSKDAGLVGICKTIWYNHHFIALEITSSRNHRFYSIVYSTGGATTQLKKIISSHPDKLQKIECKFMMPLSAYIYSK
jgi:hypothetical protein